MKKLLTLGLALIMLFGCTSNSSNDDPTAYELYNTAYESMRNEDKLAATLHSDITMSVDEETIDMTMDMELAMEQNGDNDGNLAMKTTTDTMGFSIELNAYYKDGWYYMEMLGQKFKSQIPMDEALAQTDAMNEQANFFSEEDFKDATVTKNNGKTVIKLNSSKSLQDKLSKNILEQAGMNELDADINFGDLVSEVTIDADGRLEKLYYAFPIELNVEGETLKMDSVMEMEYTAYGDEVTITFPDDLDEYVEQDLSSLLN